MKTVLCMKWGRKYGPAFVNALHRGVAEQLEPPFRFLCLTDDPAGLDSRIEHAPLPDLAVGSQFSDRRRHGETWPKLAIFRRGTAELEGPILFLDIDVAISGDLGRLFAFEPERFCIIRDWLEARRAPLRRILDPHYNRDSGVNTSVFRFEMPKHAYLYDHLLANQGWADRFRVEQNYLGAAIGDRAYWPDAWVVSFKRACLPAFPLNLLRVPAEPRDASVIVFHGRPNPDEAIAGYDGPLLRRTRPAPWLERYWRV